MATGNLQTGRVSKIAFFNPYLSAGHRQTAEIETTARLIQAGNNTGIEIRSFADCGEIEYFSPDFVLSMCFQGPKLTRFPTYGNMDVPPSLIKNVPRFVRNVLTWDGVYTISPAMKAWLGEIFAARNKKLHLAQASHTLPVTQFKSANYRNAVAMYVGTNWDGQRHKNLFELLKSGRYLRCYGPQKSWAKYLSAFYGGEIPFDGISVTETYNKCGAGLCIGHPAFDREGVPSSRTFEIAAAGAVPICSDTALNKQIYGAAALYVNNEAETHDLAAQITEAVRWIRSHPSRSEEMARQAHTIFNESLSMEFFLQRIIEMHQAVRQENYCRRSDAIRNVSAVKNRVTFILAAKYADYRLEPVLSGLAAQSYGPVDVIVPAKNGRAVIDAMYKKYCDLLNVTCMPDDGPESRREIFGQLKNNGTDWLGIITPDGRLFPNHLSALLGAFESNPRQNQPIAGLLADSLEFSEDIHLPELEPDEHIVPNEFRVRLAGRQLVRKKPVHSALINFNLLDLSMFSCVDFYSAFSEVLMCWLEKRGSLVNVPHVTCATRINNDADLLRQVKVLEKTKSEMQAVINAQNQSLAVLTARSADLDQLYASRSWRYTAFVRQVTGRLRAIMR